MPYAQKQTVCSIMLLLGEFGVSSMDVSTSISRHTMSDGACPTCMCGAKNVSHKSPQRQFCDAITFNAKSVEERGLETLLEIKRNIHSFSRSVITIRESSARVVAGYSRDDGDS